MHTFWFVSSILSCSLGVLSWRAILACYRQDVCSAWCSKNGPSGLLHINLPLLDPDMLGSPFMELKPFAARGGESLLPRAS